MKRLIFILPLMILLIFISGCNSRRSLDRTPPKREKRAASRPKTQPRRKSSNDGKLFDTIFHRNPQRFENSQLTPAEKKLMDENDVHSDRDIQQIRRKNQNTRGQDWVFGTKNGSFF